MPKRNERTRASRFSIRTTFDVDDPARAGRWGTLAGAALTAATLFGFGPPLIEGLNAMGLVLTF